MWVAPPRRRVRLTAAFIALAVVAAVAPIALCVLLARNDAGRRQHIDLQAFARRAAERVDLVSRQAAGVLAEILRLPDRRCSPAYLASVRRISFTSRYVQDAGAFQDGAVICSALHGYPLQTPERLPASGWRDFSGLQYWVASGAPSDADHTAILIGLDGAYVAIDAQSYVDVVDQGDKGIAVLNSSNGEMLASTEGADRVLMKAAWEQPDSDRNANYLFVVERASTTPLAIVVSAPKEQWFAASKARLTTWLGVGLLSGIALCGFVLRQLSHRLSLGWQLKQAVQRRNLEVHYQPIIRLDSGRCLGAEALVRWRCDGSWVPPDLFIPLAERLGLLNQVTHQVLDIVVADLRYPLLRTPAFYVSLNASVDDLKDDHLLQVLNETLTGTGIHREQIRVEVTERSFMDLEAGREAIRALRDMGHPVYIDDFGTGYSSLSYLQHFEVDALKIDRSFVETIDEDPETNGLIPHIISMAHSLGIEIVAEGVEHEIQADYLRGAGAQYGQGWWFGKAMPLEELLHFIDNNGHFDGH